MRYETTQRFLRGEDRVARKRRRRGRLARLGVVFAILVGLFVGWGVATVGYRGLMSWSALAVTTIDIEGAVRSQTDDLRARLAVIEGHNILTLDLQEVRELVKSEPWVKDATVQRIIPDRLVVRVVERNPRAVNALTDELIDEAGNMVTGSHSLPEDGSLPRVLPGKDAKDVGLEHAMQVIRTLDRSSTQVMQRVRLMDVREPHNVRLVMKDSARVIHLGAMRFAERLNRYLNVEALIAHRYPSSTSVDLRFANRVIVSPLP